MRRWLIAVAATVTFSACCVGLMITTAFADPSDGWHRVGDRTPIGARATTAEPTPVRPTSQTAADPTAPLTPTAETGVTARGNEVRPAGYEPSEAAHVRPAYEARSVDAGDVGSDGSIIRQASRVTFEPAALSGVQPTSYSSPSGFALPRTAGQVWREYDIREYTRRIATTRKPEQALVDWILRETGYESWHGDPLAILSADSRTLRVYHTPAMQEVVGEMVDRFVREVDTIGFSLRVATVAHPSWRAMAHNMLKPIPSTTPGVSAWVVDPEDMTTLLTEIHNRGGFREHSSPHLLVENGQTTIVSSRREKSYTRDIAARDDAWPGLQAETGKIDEGFALEFSPLLARDLMTVDAVLKCDIDQVERLVSINVPVTSQLGPQQNVRLEVPQMTQLRFQERFRWPTDKVLVVALGVVPLPVPSDASRQIVPGVPLPLPSGPPRADLVIMIQSQSKRSPTTAIYRPADGVGPIQAAAPQFAAPEHSPNQPTPPLQTTAGRLPGTIDDSDPTWPAATAPAWTRRPMKLSEKMLRRY